jgi:dsDNA-specific endonuclease/ATPase MutS2
MNLFDEVLNKLEELKPQINNSEIKEILDEITFALDLLSSEIK